MKVKIKALSDKAQLPKKKHSSDFCYDVYATSIEYPKENVIRYGLGLAFQIVRENIPVELTHNGEAVRYIPCPDPQFMQFSIDFRPRSSVWETGLVLSNCEGTIDEEYTGEVAAVFYKVAEGEPYKVGDRIGQIKLGFTLPMEFDEVLFLEETERGGNGWGSSGRK